MKLSIKISSIKKIFNIYIILFVFAFLMHEFIFNKHLTKSDVLFAKDFHDITSTVLDIGYVVYTNSLLKSSFFLQTNFFISMSVSVLSVEIIKHIFKKERPDKSDNKSFPSGHTAIAFVCFFWIFIYMKSFLMFLPAITIGILRIFAKRHDIFDVSGGILLSFLICFIIYKISIFIKNSRLKNFIKFY